PPSVVADVDPQAAVAFGQRDLDATVRAVAELDGVRQQIEHDLDHAVEIDGYGRDLIGQLRFDPDVLLPEQLIHRGESVGDDLLHVDLGLGPVGLARLDLGQVENLVD